jgi:hypothetical protein
MFFNLFENLRKISIYGATWPVPRCAALQNHAINAYFSHILKSIKKHIYFIPKV